MSEQTENPQSTGQGTPEPMEYRTEVKQLLDILAHSLYTDREIFLRELISNASDALHRVQFEMLTNSDVVDSDVELAIHIHPDAEAKTLTLVDSGIGMNREELIANLGTIAHSGAKTFLQNAGESQSTLEEIIGQFGVGFYSVFMVAAEVTVRTRSYRPEDGGWMWHSSGDNRFTLEPLDKPTRGTEIEIVLKEDAHEFATPWRIEQIVQRHSDYVSFPIYLHERAEPQAEDELEAGDAEVATTDETQTKILNRRTALWRQTPSQVKAEEYNEFYRQLTFDTEDPLRAIHMSADAPVNVRAILYIPARRERGRLQMGREYGLRLYSRKILIQERNQELLPEYYRFVDGVVDSDDLPLNVSREMVQSNPVMRQLQRALANRITRELKNLAENDAEKYATFWEAFGAFLKEGVAMDLSGQDTLRELLRFRTSRRDDQWISIADYVAAMSPGQDAIYYVLGDDMKSASRSPHLEYFRAHDLEVLYLVDPIDGFMVSNLREIEGKPLRNIDDAGLELPTDDTDSAQSKETEEGAPLDDARFNRLVEMFVGVLGERVRGVQASRQLVSSPCRLVSPEDSFDRDLQRILRMTEESYEAPTKILELNRKHPLIVNLAQMIDLGQTQTGTPEAGTPDAAGDSQESPAVQLADPLIVAAIEQLFTNARLLDGQPANPVDMVDRIQTLMEAAVAARVK